MKVYPIFLNALSRKKCIVIGGNHEAEEKVRGLLACDANLTLISAEATLALDRLAEEGTIEWIRRDYTRGDLSGAFLVIAVRSDQATQDAIFQEAEAENALVNVMDDIPNCNFVAGSVVRQGPLAISISTGGAAPALAVRIRESLEKQFGSHYGEFLEICEKLRTRMAEEYPEFDSRKEVWYRVVDSDVLDYLRRGDREGALARISDVVGFRPTSLLTF